MKRLIASAALLLAATAQPATAQGGPQENLSCDAPTGRVTRYQRIVGPAPLRFEAAVKVKAMRTDPKWRPIVNVMLTGGKPELRAGFRMMGNAANGNVAIFAVVPGMKAEDAAPFGEVGANQPIVVSVTGTVTGSQLSVNGLGRSGPALAKGNWVFEISCSTIDVAVDALVVRPQIQPPPAPAAPAAKPKGR